MFSGKMFLVFTVLCLVLVQVTKAVVPTRRTCKCVLSTCKNVGKMWGSVRGEYRLSTDLGARRHAVALLVHEELLLRSGCGRATDSPQYGWRTCLLQPMSAQRTDSVSLLNFFPRSLALRTAHLASACCARDKCVVCAYPALPQFYCPMSTQNWRGPYRVSTCSALTTHVVRTDFCSIYYYYYYYYYYKFLTMSGVVEKTVQSIWATSRIKR